MSIGSADNFLDVNRNPSLLIIRTPPPSDPLPDPQARSKRAREYCKTPLITTLPGGGRWPPPKGRVREVWKLLERGHLLREQWESQ